MHNALLLIVPLLGAALVLIATSAGMGIAPDSIVYLSAGRNIVEGKGLTVPAAVVRTTAALEPQSSVRLTLYPPLLPLGLALFGFAHLDPAAAARWFNAALLSANALLVGVIVYRITGRLAPAVFAQGLMITAVDLLLVHTVLFSEPLFLLLGFAGLALLPAAAGQGRFLLASALLLAAAFLTRYLGVAMIGAAVLALLWLTPGPLRVRAARAAGLGFVAALPMMALLLANRLWAGSATGRPVTFHPVAAHHLREALDAFEGWIMPSALPRPLGIAVALGAALGLAVLVLATLWRFTSPPGRGRHALVPILALFAVLYVAAIVLAISLIDYHVTLKTRLLLPLFVAAIVLAVTEAERVLRGRWGSPPVRTVVVVLAMLFLAVSSLRAGVWVMRGAREGLGYAGHMWRRSPILREVRALPPEVLSYSNGADLIYFMTGRAALSLPSKVDQHTLAGNHDYAAQLQEMRRRVASGGAVIVLLGRVPGRPYLPTEAELAAALPLRTLSRAADGTIYGTK